jgi:hypothetical protein
MTATAVAIVTGYSAYWIGQIARRYNADGPNGVRDQRHAACTGRPELPASHLAELGAVVASPHPLGDRWCGRTVAQWLTERLGRRVGRQLVLVQPTITVRVGRWTNRWTGEERAFVLTHIRRSTFHRQG